MKNTPLETTRCFAAASLLVVFILDMVAPSAFVVDILYVCCILLMFRESPRAIIIFSIIASLLVIADVIFFDSKLKLGPSFWANRAMSILAIVITSNLVIRFRKLDDISRLKKQQHLEALEEILFITSHRMRKPVANIIGLADLSDTDSILSAKDLKKRCQYLSFSAIELDTIIKELNNFIEQSERQGLSPDTVKPISHLYPAPKYTTPAKFEKVA